MGTPASETDRAVGKKPSAHREHFVMGLYASEMDFVTRYRRPERRYVLATIPRSGSTLFSIRLWQSGQLGAPLENLNFRMAAGLFERLGYALREDGRPRDAAQLTSYWETLQQLRTSANGVFGGKLFVCNLMTLADRYPEFLPHLAPTHVVYLTRMDLVRQAISYYRAQQSNAWFGGARGARIPDYDFARIQACLVSICAQMAVWEKLFVAWGVAPLRVYYEQVCRHPRRVVAAVKAHLGIAHDPVAGISVPLIIRQADHVTDAWRARFFEDGGTLAGAVTD